MKTNTATIPVLDEPTDLEATSVEGLGLQTVDQPEVTTDLSTGVPSRSAEPLAELKTLNVWFDDGHGGRRHVVHDLDLSIYPGECVAIIGESGSGKSVTARTLIGLTGENAHIEAEQARVLGHDIAGLKDRQWKDIRGKHVGFILQDALVSLDPLRTVGAEIGESLLAHGTARKDIPTKVQGLLNEVGIPEPQLRADQRPDELSGGLRQRALIASAIANDPALVVADEPTTALDVTVQAEVLDVLAERQRNGTAILLISHDFSVVSRLADRIFVMQGGHIVESGKVERILNNPQHPYTRQLLDALPSGHTRGSYLTAEARQRAAQRQEQGVQQAIDHPTADSSNESAAPILSARNLTKTYRGPDGRHRAVVNDVSFDVYPGQTLGIVGESGSGKSTAASLALGFIQPDSGRVLLDGQPWSELNDRERRGRRRDVTVVYQDPLSSFDPRWTAERILTDALDQGSRPGFFASRATRQRYQQQLRDQAAGWAQTVGLDPQHLAKHPLQLSGGQRQRLAIARALAPEPKVVILDEAVSALDVSVQAQVLDLLTELRQTVNTAFLFISHDLGVIHHMSDQILVMKDGHAVEYGDAEQLFQAPEHPYTQTLLQAVRAVSA